MHRTAAFLAAFLVACAGGPIDRDTDDTGDDTADDTGDTGDTADTDTGTGVGDEADELDGIFEDCGRAIAGAIQLEPGNYSGATDNWDASLDGTCVAGGGAGPEKLFAIDVPTDTRLTVDFRVQGNDARLYLVENCNLSGVCVASSNTAGGNASEHIEWVNSSGDTTSLYVVLDTRDVAEAGETWTLAVELESFTPPTLLPIADACDDLGGVTPITGSDSFAIDMTGFVNDYSMDYYTGCTGWYSSGVDGIVPVVVPDGATISATWGHPTCDASLYMLETCGELDTCLAGQDYDSFGDETITWQNTTGRDGTFLLGLDHGSTGCVPTVADPGTLTVTIEPPLPIGADTCAEAEALAAVAPGQYYVLLGGQADDLDQGDAVTSCTGQATPGEDVFLPVSVPAGNELRARFTTGSGNAAIYAVTDCEDADSCVGGVDEGDPEELRWINESGSTALVYVAFDSRYPSGHDDEPSSGLLQLDVFPPIGDIPLADRCSDLPGVPRVGEGTHVIVMDNFINNIDLGAGNACTGWSATGVDGLVQVRVKPGWTLDADYNAGCDGTLYILTECADTTSCVDGSDAAQIETVSWLNDTGSTVDAVVVMDAWSGCRPTRTAPGHLTVDLIPPPSIGADTCALAIGLPPVSEGIHEVDLSDANADFDTTTLTGCGDVATSTGDEVYVPIALEAGEAVNLSFDPDAGDPSLYLLEDCDTTPVCLDGVDGGNPETLYWVNDSGDALTIVAVIDTNAAESTSGEPQRGFLEVTFDFPVVPLSASDTCEAASAVSSGRYEIDLTGFADDLDLDDGASAPCTDGERTPGTDAFVQISLAAGETVDLEWDASISTSGIKNGSIYLLDECDVDACLVGADAGDPEQIDYTNSTASTQLLTVGLDAWSTNGGPNKGILTVTISP